MNRTGRGTAILILVALISALGSTPGAVAQIPPEVSQPCDSLVSGAWVTVWGDFPPMPPECSNPQNIQWITDTYGWLFVSNGTYSEVVTPEVGGSVDGFASEFGPDPSAGAIMNAVDTEYFSAGIDTAGDPKSIHCKAAMHQIVFENRLGDPLYAYKQKVQWCFNKKKDKILTVERTRWPEVYALLWSWEGHIGSQQSGGVGNNYYRSFTQGYFKLCLGPFGCWQHSYPWLETTVFGTGGVERRHGG